MAENTFLLWLKESESQENILSKVDRLTAHNGTNGVVEEGAHLCA